MGTGMTTSQALIEIADGIAAALNEQTVAATNKSIPKRIEFLAAQCAGLSTYAAEKAHKIARLAEIFYSERRHESYPGGAQALWQEITHELLKRITQDAQTRKNHGD